MRYAETYSLFRIQATRAGMISLVWDGGTESLVAHDLIVTKHLLIPWQKYQTRRIQWFQPLSAKPSSKEIGQDDPPVHLPNVPLPHLPNTEGERRHKGKQKCLRESLGKYLVLLWDLRAAHLFDIISCGL